MKRKFLYLLIVFLLCVLFFTSNVFAFDYEDFYGNKKSVPDIPDSIDISKGYIIKPNGGSWSYFFTCVSDNCYAFLNNNKTFHLFGTYKVYRMSNGSYNYEGTSTYNSTTATSQNNVGELNQFTYSTVPVYKDSSKKEIFFQVAPPTALAKVMMVETKKQPQMVMKEIVGVLPLILVVVVSLLGLRKGLTALLTFLKTV